jgi:hypothetical protein
MSATAVQLARASYPYVCSAFGGVNHPGGDRWHLKRAVHPNHMWEMELQIQSLLEFESSIVDPIERMTAEREGVIDVRRAISP